MGFRILVLSVFMFGLVVCPEIERLPILQALAAYQEYFASGDGHTPRAKRYDLDYFREFLALVGKAHADVIEITQEDIVEFREHRLRVESPATVTRRLKTLKHLFKVLADRYPGFYPPTKGVRPPLVRRMAPQRFTRLEMAQLEESVDGLFQGAEQQLRARVVLNLGRFEGLRSSELRSCTVGQYCPLTKTLRDVRRKATRFQTFALHEASNDAILNYLPAREQALIDHWRGYLGAQNKAEYPLIVSTWAAKRDRPDSYQVSAKSLYRMVRSLGDEIEVKAHPHKLRHTCCHELLEVTDLPHVSDLMGHGDVNTTRGYLGRGLEEDRAVQKRRTV